MALFEYKAIDKTGKNKKGKIDATSIKQATTKIKSQGLHIISITSSKENIDKSSAKGKTAKRKTKVPSQVVTNFTRQLSMLISTGIPYDKAFEILIEECEHASFQHVLSSMKAQIVEGSSLAAALEGEPSIFPQILVSMVQAGEAGGTLPKVLNQVANSRESNEKLASKIQGAMIYPIIMTCVGIGIVVFMITFIIPKILPIFHQFNIDLPLPTKIVLTMSDFVTANWWQLIFLGFGLTFLFRRLLVSKSGRRFWDSLILRIPYFGGVLHKIVIYRFTQTLGTMMISGVELKQSLDIIKHVVGNKLFEERLDQLSIDITKKGMDLSYALRQTQVFPLSVIQMIRVGEESSQLEEMLVKIADLLENDVKQSIEKSISLLEPLMILWMAVMVGFIVLSVLLPMLELNQMI